MGFNSGFKGLIIQQLFDTMTHRHAYLTNSKQKGFFLSTYGQEKSQTAPKCMSVNTENRK